MKTGSSLAHFMHIRDVLKFVVVPTLSQFLRFRNVFNTIAYNTIEPLLFSHLEANRSLKGEKERWVNFKQGRGGQ